MIEVCDVSFTYPGEDYPALVHATLQVAPRDVVGIVGPNGSGKSTLSRLMKGLLLPTEGEVRIDAIDTRTDTLASRRMVGLVFQNPNSQIVNAIVDHEVAFGPENLGLPAEQIRRRVTQSLEATGLVGREHAECHSLSMADKQRVAIAAVMAMEPHYLILDEPTAWLEPVARRSLLDRILRWCRERDAGLVIVTHRMDEAQVCDRLYGILDGRIEVTGPPQEVLNDEDARRGLHLEVPETLVLATALRDAGLPVQPGETIDGIADALTGRRDAR